MVHRPGDMVLADFLIDSKQNSGSGLQIPSHELNKLLADAASHDKVPAILFTALKRTDVPQWVAVPLETFAYLVRREFGEGSPQDVTKR